MDIHSNSDYLELTSRTFFPIKELQLENHQLYYEQYQKTRL